MLENVSNNCFDQSSLRLAGQANVRKVLRTGGGDKIQSSKFYFFVITIVISVNSSVSTGESIFNTKYGLIQVLGPTYDKQIYLINANEKINISNFGRWENIQRTEISPDNKLLFVYHRPNKKKYKMSLIDLENRKTIGSIDAKFALHNLFWYKDKILYETDTSGGGRQIRIFDYNLIQRGHFSGYRLEFNIENGYAFSIPTYSAEEGVFYVYGLLGGEILDSFEFNNEIGEFYYISLVEPIGKSRYRIYLESEDSKEKKMLEKEIHF